MTDEAPTAPFASWAIVELMGHRQRAGMVTEAEMMGTKLLRVDIPVEGGDPVTEFYGGSSIYALRPVSEEIATEFARHSDPRPVNPAAYRLAAPPVDYDDEDERPF